MDRSSNTLVAPLFDGTLDIIGDVHGEYEALCLLLKYLGYNRNGDHPQHRHLVFVGDMCDRGTNSPATLKLIRHMQVCGRAQVILGNHELNILMNDPKDGSGWFFPEQDTIDRLKYPSYCHIPSEDRVGILAWLSTLPIALENSHLRIVHAAWHDKAIAALRSLSAHTPIPHYFAAYDRRAQELLQQVDWLQNLKFEKMFYETIKSKEEQTPPLLKYVAQYELWLNGHNPLRLISSGIEEIATRPFFAAGRWRMIQRYPWWDYYQDDTPIIFGHYWRTWRNSTSEEFSPPAGSTWLGVKHNAFCIDYSAGRRWKDRLHGIPPKYSMFRLAALRYPEYELVFDNGDVQQLKRPFSN